MTQAPAYPELVARDQIKAILINDSYIGTQILNSRTNTKNISTISLLEITIPHYPYISIDFMNKSGTDYSQSNEIEKISNIIEILVACQEANRETAYDNAFKLAKDVKFTLEQNRNLDFNCDYLEISEVYPVAYLPSTLWTWMFGIKVNVDNYEDYFNPGNAYPP
jgi:hypothetical protein